jgi:hypothetical protein
MTDDAYSLLMLAARNEYVVTKASLTIDRKLKMPPDFDELNLLGAVETIENGDFGTLKWRLSAKGRELIFYASLARVPPRPQMGCVE